MNILSLLLSIAITGVVFVNGFTDAPNAIATVVGTKVMKNKTAVIMCSILNFFGTLIMAYASSKVSDTISGMISFASDKTSGIIALFSAMVAIIIWSVFAWAFAIPTSESHALVAGLVGAAVSLNGFSSGVNIRELSKVFVGLIISVLGGLLLGFIINKLFVFIFSNKFIENNRNKFSNMQIFNAMVMSFLHGAQDGQKFIAIFVISSQISRGIYTGGVVDISGQIGICLLCSLVMGLGTSFGGGKIIESVGSNMVKMDVSEGLAADIASNISLLFLSIFGYPVSTTQVKTTAIMGVGIAKGRKNINFKIIRDMFMAWILTFPICFLLSFLISNLVYKIFMLNFI